VRIRLIAPFEHRVRQWVKRSTELARETPNQRAAADFLRRDDGEKRGRMRYLYEVDVDEPTLYDIVFNTEKLPYEAIVDMIERAARHPAVATTERARQIVADRALASRVQVALAIHPETRRYRLTVESQNGIVTIEGTTALEQALQVAREVPGVRDVRTRPLEVPPIPPFVA
jgi:hypothetical protein